MGGTPRDCRGNGSDPSRTTQNIGGVMASNCQWFGSQFNHGEGHIIDSLCPFFFGLVAAPDDLGLCTNLLALGNKKKQETPKKQSNNIGRCVGAARWLSHAYAYS